MFPTLALPESVLHAQFRLKATGLPARAKRRAVVRLTDLKFVERPAVLARFSALLDASMQAHPGVGFRVLDERTRTAQLDGGNWPRYDILHELHFELENLTDAAVSFNEIVTIAGNAVEVDAPASAPPALVPQALELEAQTVGCVPLLARFEEVGGALRTQRVEGQAIVTDLAVGAKTEITIDHASTRTFSTPLSLLLTSVSAGFRVTPLLARANGDKTTGGQFVLLVENVSASVSSYGASAPDCAMEWERRGYE